MDMKLTSEQEMIRSTAAEIAADFGPEYWREKDAEGEFAQEFWDELAEAGFHGLLVPEEYGGAGMGMQEMAIAIEAIAREGTGLAGPWHLISPNTMVATIIDQYATEEQREHYLSDLAVGEPPIAFGITEPEAGTNTLNIDTFAEHDGDEFVINGQKAWITYADVADRMILVTRTSEFDPSNKSHGMTLFFVDDIDSDDGVEISSIPKHGFNYTNSCEVFFEDVRVPEENVLGKVDQGWSVLVNSLNPERIGFAAGAVGVGRLAANTAIEYSNEREVFDGPIGQYQSIQHPIAKGWAQLDGAELMMRNAAAIYDDDEDCGYEANSAKAVAIEAAHDTVFHSMQTFGGWGYAKEYDLERWWREINLTRLAPVTQQMAYNHIAQTIGFPRSY